MSQRGNVPPSDPWGVWTTMWWQLGIQIAMDYLIARGKAEGVL